MGAQARAQAPTAESSQLSSLHATFRYVGGSKQEAEVEKAINRAIDDLPPGLYELAYRRISETQAPAARIVLDVEGRDIRVQRNPAKTIHTTASKSKQVVFNRQGERYVFRQSVKGNTLTQSITGLGNKTRLTYRLSEDGTLLTYRVHINADLLPSPVEYKLSYKRE
jgi:hypothetical protein